MNNCLQARWLLHYRRWNRLTQAGCILALMAVFPARQAIAQSSFLAYSAVCFSGEGCSYGDTVIWAPPDGSAVGSAASHGWSYVSKDDNTSSNYAVSAGAQATISGVNRWSASTSAGGYFNSPGTYGGKNVEATGFIVVRDEFTLPGTPSWAGPGWLQLSYRITGGVALSYAETSSVTGQTLGSALSSISFECGSARVGGQGSSLCESPDFPAPAPGSVNLTGHIDFDTSQGGVDKTISFSMPVYSDQLYAYRLQTAVTSSLTMYATNRTGLINGLTSADFGHTISLVDAQLFDAGMNAVPDWSVQAGSGFDYAHIAAVPEPTSAALLAAGVGMVWWIRRRQGKSDRMTARDTVCGPDVICC